MTREEAIRLLDLNREYLKNTNNIGLKDDIEALNMAIKALKQEPCEDAISRRGAIKKFTYNHKGERIPDYDCDNFPIQIDVKTVKEILRDLPPVTPQPKTGRWINQHIIYANVTVDFKICSECRYEFSYDAETGVSDANYCPNCGAKMEIWRRMDAITRTI